MNQNAATLGTKDGRLVWRVDQACAEIDVSATLKGTLAETALVNEALQHLNVWSRAPDIYAVVLDVARDPDQDPVADLDGSAVASLMWGIDSFPKPIVALLQQATNTQAMAPAAAATHRIGWHDYRFCVPQLDKRAPLPLAGLAWTLARLPLGLGAYLALSGHAIGAADALSFGLLTHTIPPAARSEIIAGLRTAEPVDPLLDALGADPGPGELANKQTAIARCFSAASIEAILARLADEKGPDADWAKITAEELRQRPLAEQALVLRLIRHAATSDLRDALHLAHALGRYLASETRHDAAALDALFSVPASENFSLPTRADFATDRF